MVSAIATRTAAVTPTRQFCQSQKIRRTSSETMARRVQMGSRGSAARPAILTREGAGSPCGPSAGAAGPVGVGSGPVSRSMCHSVTECSQYGTSRPGGGWPRTTVPLPFGNVTKIHDLTVTELAAAIATGQTSSVEITDHYLDRIDRLNEQVGAFYTVTHELAREQAAAADKAVSASRQDRGELPPLTGVPIPIKDLNMVAGVRLTFGSTILADNVATEDDYMVEHLRTAGIVITGQTATPEFGLPCYTETKVPAPPRPPRDLA